MNIKDYYLHIISKFDNKEMYNNFENEILKIVGENYEYRKIL